MSRKRKDPADKCMEEGLYLYWDKDWLDNNYTHEHRTADEIAFECGCSMTEILNWLRFYDIHIRNTNAEKFTGSHHPLESRIRRMGKNNGMNKPGVREKHLNAVKSSTYRKKLSDAQIRRWSKLSPSEREPSAEKKLKLSNSANKFYLEHPDKKQFGHAPYKGSGYGKRCEFTELDGNVIWFKSSYELRTAIALSKLELDWNYECKSFKLDELNRRYFPDFYICDYNVWLEVKGYMQPHSELKINEFLDLYPNEHLRILFNEDIQELECYVDNKWKCDIINIGINARNYRR
jgi:hypothetical protein